MEQKVRNLLKKIGRDPASISKANIKSFCKNARKLAVRAFLLFCFVCLNVHSSRITSLCYVNLISVWQFGKHCISCYRNHNLSICLTLMKRDSSGFKLDVFVVRVCDPDCLSLFQSYFCDLSPIPFVQMVKFGFILRSHPAKALAIKWATLLSTCLVSPSLQLRRGWILLGRGMLAWEHTFLGLAPLFWFEQLSGSA